MKRGTRSKTPAEPAQPQKILKLMVAQAKLTPDKEQELSLRSSLTMSIHRHHHRHHHLHHPHDNCHDSHVKELDAEMNDKPASSSHLTVASAPPNDAVSQSGSLSAAEAPVTPAASCAVISTPPSAQSQYAVTLSPVSFDSSCFNKSPSSPQVAVCVVSLHRLHPIKRHQQHHHHHIYHCH